MEYRCHLLAEKSNILNIKLIVAVSVTNLCPCSKEISKGAHSKRCVIKMEVVTNHLVWVEDLVHIAEESAREVAIRLREDP